jgi:acetate kinase
MIGKGYTAEELDTILTKKSGLIGVSGVSSDAREVWAAVEEGNHRAQLAMDLVVHYARKLIGSYVAEMNGVDVLVITAGLGENDAKVRNGILTNLDYLGVKINEELNMNAPRGTMVDLTAEGSKVKVLVIPTDEELMIAKDTQKLADEFYAK